MNRSKKIGLVLAAAFLLTLAVLGAVGFYLFQREQRADTALQTAGAALEKNDFDAAILLYDRALLLRLSRTNTAIAYCGRALAENGKFQFDEAIRDFSEAMRLRAAGVNEYLSRGYAFQGKGEWDKALGDYAEALKQDENIAQVYFNRGFIFYLRKEWAKAAADFSEAIRCDGQNAYAFLNRASALAELSDLGGTLASLDSAISIDPKLVEAYDMRAVIHRRRGENDLARRDEDRAFTLAPKAPGVLSAAQQTVAFQFMAEARAAHDARRYDEAINLNNKALSSTLSSQNASMALINRGNAYRAKGDWDHALSDYDEAIKLSPKNAGAWVSRGIVYGHKHEREKSTRDYDEAIRLNPKQVEAFCSRGFNYFVAGDFPKALADWNEAIRINDKFADAYARRSMVLVEMKRLDEALADADKAVNLPPEWSESYLQRARVHLARREFAAARADFELALQREPDPRASTLNAVAWLCASCPEASIRDGSKAVKLATKACELTQWKNASLVDTLAAAYAETGDFSQAVKFQEQAINSPDLPSSSRSGMEERRALYQKHQPYRQNTP